MQLQMHLPHTPARNKLFKAACLAVKFQFLTRLLFNQLLNFQWFKWHARLVFLAQSEKTSIFAAFLPRAGVFEGSDLETAWWRGMLEALEGISN